MAYPDLTYLSPKSSVGGENNTLWPFFSVMLIYLFIYLWRNASNPGQLYLTVAHLPQTVPGENDDSAFLP